MRKDKMTHEDKMLRLRELSGININEGKVGTPSTVLDSTKGGKISYAIVREAGSYYIKSTTSDVISEATLDYIGGLANKTKNKYNSYPDALKQLNLFKRNINEGKHVPYADLSESEEETDTEVLEEDDLTEGFVKEKMEKDIDPVGDQAPAAPMPAPDAAPQGDPAMPPMPAPAPEAPVDPAMPAAPEGDAPMGEPAPAGDEFGDEGSADEFGEEGGENQLDHFVGKLTAEIRDTPEEELSEDKIKGILNSIVAALPLKRVSPEERIKIARRVKNARKDGEEEEAPVAQPEMGGEPEMSAEPAMPAMDGGEDEEEKPLAEVELPVADLIPEPKSFNSKDDEKVNEFLDKNEDSLISESKKLKFSNVLIEAVGDNIIFNQSGKEFKFNVSEATVSKFKKLLKK